MALLSLDSVEKTFTSGDRTRVVHAVRNVSLTVNRGSSIGIIGESGSGKSTLGRLGVGLLQPDEGTVLFDGVDLGRLSARDLRRMRRSFQVVFQEPLGSLDPRMRVASIVEEPLVIHERRLSKHDRRARVREALDQVGLAPSVAERRPRELSGGQQQRVGIARAIVTRPELLLLDEPVSSLDLSVRALILNLLKDLQDELELTYLFISHDIETVRFFCTETAVMLRGSILEIGRTAAILEEPQHPYTRALLSSRLSPDPRVQFPRYELQRDATPTASASELCPLVGRCPVELPRCSVEPVGLRRVGGEHRSACFHVPEDDAA
ncbi:MAG TPA: oligopeptide/dipeptide ABC transporter ATP-binding protein [Gaiellaceae bacterium]|jgi:oligopeptide/dipeptide ABC transporter ATP-binding protein|nr:oligopeptide/dipeptide ABC transporter ATP-binding protein [Gaiellaceae bacterium]